MKVHWSLRARRDLEQIRDYISMDSMEYARRMVERIVKAVERVALFPESGGMLPEWESPELRQVFIGHYRIIYRIHPELIEVALILHGARQFPDELSP